MPASAANPAVVVQEVLNGSGAIPNLPEQAPSAQQQLGAESLRLLNGSDLPAEPPVDKSWGVAVGLIGLAGGALLVSVAAIALAWQAAEGAGGARSAALAEIPRLQARVEAVAARLDRLPPAADPVAPVSERIEAVETQLNRSVEAVNQKIDRVLSEAKAEDAALALRLSHVESRQAEETAALQSLQLRTSAIDPAPTASAPAARPTARLRLKSLKGGVAVVEGPQGQASVSIGDALFDFGKVLKFDRHGRKGLIVTEQGQFPVTWPRAPAKPKPADPI